MILLPQNNNSLSDVTVRAVFKAEVGKWGDKTFKADVGCMHSTPHHINHYMLGVCYSMRYNVRQQRTRGPLVQLDIRQHGSKHGHFFGVSFVMFDSAKLNLLNRPQNGQFSVSSL